MCGVRRKHVFEQGGRFESDLTLGRVMTVNRSTGQQFEKAGPERIDIICDGGRSSGKLLRTHVGERAADPLVFDWLHDGLGQAKICQLERSVVALDQIRGFEIPMNNALAMSVAKRRAKALNPDGDFRPGEASIRFGSRELMEVDAGNVFHGDEGLLTWDFVEIMNPNYVGMTQGMTTTGFLPHDLEGFGVAGDSGREKFDGDLFFELRVMSEPDIAHATST